MTTPSSRWQPAAAAVAAVLITWYAWGTFVPAPVVNDERSYLLQAEVFATGRWTAPAPPLSEFFQQPHVLTAPAVASKYPPGHALLLSLGVLAGFAPLVPLLLAGATAFLMFRLCTAYANAQVGAIAVGIWLSMPLVLRFQPSYLSEVSTAALLLAAWHFLARWRETGRSAALIVVAACIGWAAITRPITALAAAVPLAAVVLPTVVVQKRWRQLVAPFALGTCIVGILALWSARTTGAWSRSPIAEYREQYLPFDKLGFSTDRALPRERLQPPLLHLYRINLRLHGEHTVSALPRIALSRLMALGGEMFGGWRLLLVPAFLIGIVVLPRGPRAVMAATALSVFGAHLAYAHASFWTVYYLELAPLVAMTTALGAWHVGARSRFRGYSGAFSGGLIGTAVVLAALTIQRHRGAHLDNEQLATRLDTLAANGNDGTQIVFVTYHRPTTGLNYVRNAVDLHRERTWFVHDRGDRNALLVGIAPDRAAFILKDGVLAAWEPAGDRHVPSPAVDQAP